LGGGGISLDVGSTGQPVTIELSPDTAYTLTENPNVTSDVVVNGFDENDKIVISGGPLSLYGFGHDGEDLRITTSNGTTVNDIYLTDVEVNGFVYDLESAIAAVGWNFITVA
jgi:hypothetical protein